jgi:hypothetical protein
MTNEQPPWIDEYIACFSGARHEDLEIEKAFLIKNRNLPAKLYKYRSVNDYSLKNLKNDSVWLCAARQYNDPYDCALTVSTDTLRRATVKQEFDKIILSSGLDKLMSREEIESARQNDDPMYHLASIALRKDGDIPESQIEGVVQILKDASEKMQIKN